jgi:serine/threonine-protein kinase RsbT
MPANLSRTLHPPSSAYDAVSLVLCRYLSELNAEGILLRALREASLRRDQFAHSDISGLIPRLERGIRLFLEPQVQHRIRADLEELAERHSSKLPDPCTVAINCEADISAARLSARALCVDLGMRALGVQRVVTIISELSRNIVEYTPGGAIRVSVRRTGADRVITIVARDRGTGIDNLSAILAGQYRSRGGLGKGLLGVKRLANSFDVRTGLTGTCITLEVYA